MGIVFFGILFICVGLNWLIYRSWWAENTSKHWGLRATYLMIEFKYLGVFTIILGIIFMVLGIIDLITGNQWVNILFFW
jgi:hypothetical protein